MSLESRLVCAGCDTVLAPQEARPFACPHRDAGDDVDHVLGIELDLDGDTFPEASDPNPFVAFRELFHSYRFARRKGVEDAEFVARVREIDQALVETDGRGFRFTPLARSPELESAAGVASVWIKDETGNVSGSHKARHLMGIALQLELAGEPCRELSISSCGNAALGAAVVARATGRELRAFVPPAADARVLAGLEELGTRVVACPRTPEPGDPCTHRFRADVAKGSLPFSVQGGDNALSLEGGRTLAWEMVSRFQDSPAALPDNVVLQVGGGALGSSFVGGLEVALELGALERLPRLFFVQTEVLHPLERAWRRLTEDAYAAAGESPGERTDAEHAAWWLEHLEDERVLRVWREARRRRSRYMQPWETAPESLATGILDDETYDGFVLLDALIRTGGWPLLASEKELSRAQELAEAAGVRACATGTAGLAGLLALGERTGLEEESWAVVFTGERR